MADIRDLQVALDFLERKAIRTSQGTYIKVEDLKDVAGQHKEALTLETLDRLMGPRTFQQAKARIHEDTELMLNFPETSGKAVRELQTQQAHDIQPDPPAREP